MPPSRGGRPVREAVEEGGGGGRDPASRGEVSPADRRVRRSRREVPGAGHAASGASERRLRGRGCRRVARARGGYRTDGGPPAELGGPLPPVVEDIKLGAVVRRFVGRLHDDADEVGPVPSREKGPIPLAVAQVDPHLHPRDSAAAGQGLHVLEERSETFEP